MTTRIRIRLHIVFLQTVCLSVIPVISLRSAIVLRRSRSRVAKASRVTGLNMWIRLARTICVRMSSSRSPTRSRIPWLSSSRSRSKMCRAIRNRVPRRRRSTESLWKSSVTPKKPPLRFSRRRRSSWKVFCFSSRWSCRMFYASPSGVPWMRYGDALKNIAHNQINAVRGRLPRICPRG